MKNWQLPKLYMVQSKLLLNYTSLKHYFFNRNDGKNMKKLGINPTRCITVEQVHGSKLAVVKDKKPQYYCGGDGLVTKKPLFMAIKTADCLPVFFFEPNVGIIAAVHAGWRGLALGIVEKTIKTIIKLGGKKEKIVCAIGPHIRSCCYQVSESRITRFGNLGYHVETAAFNRNNHWYLDLGLLALQDMIRLGISKKNFDIIPVCTCCNKDYYSFRREGDSSGRMWNIIGKR